MSMIGNEKTKYDDENCKMTVAEGNIVAVLKSAIVTQSS